MGVQGKGVEILEDRYALLLLVQLLSLNISLGTLSYLQKFKYLKTLSLVSPPLLILELGGQSQSGSIRKCHAPLVHKKFIREFVH